MRTTLRYLGLATLLAACVSPPPPVVEKPLAVETPPAVTEVAEPAVEEPPAEEVELEENPAKAPPERSLPERGSHIPVPKVPRKLTFQETALARTVAQAKQGIAFTSLPGQGENRTNLIRGTAEAPDVGAWYTIDYCTRTVKAAHALSHERDVTKFGVYDISTVRIDHDGQMLWSAALACELLVEDDTACEGDIVYEVPNVVSVVGPIFSFTVDKIESRACGAAQSIRGAHTIDTRTGRSAPFGALIETDSMVAALSQHTLLRRALDPQRLDAARKLEAVWEEWGVKDFASFGAYYFGEWSPERGQVAMHLWYRILSTEEKPQELVVWVTPKPGFKAAFEDAASGASGALAAAKPEKK